MGLCCILFLGGELCVVLSLVVNCLLTVRLGEHYFLISIAEKAGSISKKKGKSSPLLVTIVVRLAAFTDICYLSLCLGVLDKVRYLQYGTWNRGGDGWMLLIICVLSSYKDNNTMLNKSPRYPVL